MPNRSWNDDDWRGERGRNWRDDDGFEARDDEWRGARENWETPRRPYSRFEAGSGRGSGYDERRGRSYGYQTGSQDRYRYGYGGGSTGPESHRDLYAGSRYDEDWGPRSYGRDEGDQKFTDGRPGHRPDTYAEDRRMSSHNSDQWTGHGGTGPRSFIDRAGDEVASWLGDEDAARRRNWDHVQDHRGRGPKGYVRADERIRDDVNDRLTYDRHLDATDIEVSVSNGEVTLNGTVEDRFSKRHAEDLVENLHGVSNVQNNLRVRARIPSEQRQTGTGTQASGETRTSYMGSATTSQDRDNATPRSH